METRKAIRKRRTIKKYRARDVPVKLVFEILDCARWAPTYNNAESWEFVVVKSDEKRKELARDAGQEWVNEAPVIIVVCANLDRARFFIRENVEKMALMECSMAVENMLLAAKDLGLGSAVVGDFDVGKVKEIIKAPKDVIPVAMVTIGYQAEFPVAKRAPLNAFLHIEEFGKPWQGEIPKEYLKKRSREEFFNILE